MSSNITQTSNFSPNQISGCQLWLDAADSSSIATSGTTVTGVSDKSGTAKTITVTNTVSYLSKQSIVFTNANGCLNVTGMPSAPYDILTVATANSVVNIYRTLLRTAGSPGTHPFLLEVNTNNVGMWDGTAFRQFGSLTMTPNEKALMYATMASGRTMQAAKNGTEALTLSTNAGNESQIAAIGNVQGGAGGQPWGTLQELIIYNTTLSTANRQVIEGYLAWKWGLNLSLPFNHPYYNTPVYSLNMPNVIFPLYAYKTLPFSFPGYTVPPYAINGVLNPKSLSGCVVWFDAKDIATLVLNGTNISTWTSKGSSSLTATASGTIKYERYNGKLALRFNGVDSKMTTGSISSYGASATTWITASVNLTAVTTLTPVDASLVFASDTSTVEKSIRYTNIANVTNSQIYTFNPNLASMRYSTNYDSGIRGFIDTAASFTAYVNGANATSVTNAVTYTAVTNPTFVMGQWSSGTLNGYIQEIIVYDRALSLLEYQQVEGYLAWKWGTVGNLPSSHPYKVFPPPP